VALADPELELLNEILFDDPSDEAHLGVAREYVRRRDWSSALRVLNAATEAGGNEAESWSLLAQSAFHATQYLRALAAIDRFGADVEQSDLLSRIRIEALLCAGRTDRARKFCTTHLARFPTDSAASALMERMRDRTPEMLQRRQGMDPLLTAERAEGYASMGRVDRAVRVYRRLLFHDPSNVRYDSRLRELQGVDSDSPDDLSEELAFDMSAQRPPRLSMPAPGVATPTPGFSARRQAAPSVSTAVPVMERDAYDEVSRRDIARAIEAQRRMTGTSTARSAVPDDNGATMTPAADVVRAAEEIDVDELRQKIRKARERRVSRRSLIRK
jgi:tetratricopeptide (TPR) repeat protein